MNLATKLFIFVFAFFVVFLLGVNYARAATYNVTVNGSTYNFTPSSLTINAGDTVKWTVSGANAHVVASDTHLVHYDYPDPSCQNNSANCWQSPVLFDTNTYSFTFMIAGTWKYHDHQDPALGSGVAGPATIIVNDTNGPATTTDLVASNADLNSIKLTWTSGGDDGGKYVNVGTPNFYDIRYSTSNITNANWSAATAITGEPSPQAAGTSQTMTVTGLTSNTTYYFAMKSSDEVPNESALSNVTSLATTAVPAAPAPIARGQFDSTPPSDIRDLRIDMTSTSSVSFSWSATGDDGSDGAAEAYDMRYAEVTIGIGNWPFITQVIGEPKPKGSGAKESIVISNLISSTLYYFALSSFDEIGNTSGLSNIVSTTTLAVTVPPSSTPISPPPSLGEPTKEVFPEEPSPKGKEIVPTPIPHSSQKPIIEGDLIRAVGDGKVYVIKNNKRVWIPTVESFNALGYNWDKIRQVSMLDIMAKSEAELMRIAGKPEVYAINNGKKRHIPSAEAFVKEGHNWDDVVVLPEAHALAYSTVSLLRVSGDEKIYIIEDGLRRHIPNIQSFNTYGYKWNDVVNVSAGVLSGYKETGIILNIRDYEVYLAVWSGDLLELIISLDSEASLSREVEAALKLGDVEICFDTRYYGGGNGRTLFNFDIESAGNNNSATSNNIDTFKKYLKGWISDLSRINYSLNKDTSIGREIRSALTLGNFELCLDVRHGYHIR